MYLLIVFVSTRRLNRKILRKTTEIKVLLSIFESFNEAIVLILLID
jgi:hypothetical protein